MSKSPWAFKPSEIKRALEAAEKAGFKAGRVEIDRTGKIVLIAATEAADTGSPNEWDSVQ